MSRCPPTGTAGWIGGFVRNNGERPIHVLVRRDGIDEMHSVGPVMACAIPIELQSDSSMTAFASDEGIVVSTGILRAARTDAQLALIIGHKLAHANLGHLNKRRVNEVIGWVGGAAIDAGTMLGGMPTRGVFSKTFARARGHSASHLSGRPTMPAPTMRHVPAMIPPVQKKSGVRSQWQTRTAFASQEIIRSRLCVLFRCKRWPMRSRTRNAEICRWFRNRASFNPMAIRQCAQTRGLTELPARSR